MWSGQAVILGVASVSEDGTIQGNGYGQAVITASAGDFQTQCQVTVKVSENNTPLTKPVLKLSQKSADQIHLTWKKVPGAKGYQILLQDRFPVFL